MTFINFTNKVMSSIQKMIFGISLPRMTEEMKVYMHNSNEPIGDWFLYKYFTVLRVYGFEDEPHGLPVFLTKSAFVLEFLRQRLWVESEIFLKHKKDSNMNFKYTIEPSVFNLTTALSIIQNIMKSMNFSLEKKINYDPKHVISQSKIVSGLGTYEHVENEVLALIDNHNYIEHEHEEDKESEEKTMVDPVTSTITPFKGENTLKRLAIEVTNMEIDFASKKSRVSTQGKEIVIVDDDDEESINRTK